MINKYLQTIFLTLVVAVGTMQGQEIQIFTLDDFDLKGEVKFCLVSTDYGKEEYDFNKKGFLTKAVTRYNAQDYDVVHYKYSNGELIEKRSESYRNNAFDSSTSIAHFYEIDSTDNIKIEERIFSYDKEFLDEYIYGYDEFGDLISIKRTNNDGTDITLIEHKKFKGENTVTYMINEVPLKSIRTSTQKPKNKPAQKIVLTKEYLKGEESYAFEEVFSLDGKLMAQQEFEFNIQTKKFEPTTRTSYEYDDKGMLIAEVAKRGAGIIKKEYVYQYDKAVEGNWIKQIVTPDNTYTTRKITYYPKETKVIKE
ncbi:hypothetical protein [Maribacter sp. Hel_I_7]|uniref:hypothetical protein n=1 Tax=Maribacter sp. Hel_I_7 TaxID=1249997 RepID=UPI00047B5044|nr:hypothetical protein [Maribacter sp. Hel_I_7]|tara:strand:+ start:7859 stop:8788 length:930 start_codon:yes stop_codon:yes gene_type:complete